MFPKFPRIPKFLKPHMNWFLYGGLILMVVAAIAYVMPHQSTVEDPLKFHTQKDLDVITEMVRDKPDSVNYITFLKVRGARDNYPGRVMLDGKNKDQSYWSEISGDREYQRISDVADGHHVAIKSKVVDPEPESGSLITAFLMQWLPTLALIIAAGFFLPKMVANATGSKNTKVNLVRLDLATTNPIKLADVAGIDDEKQTLQELVTDLKYPEIIQNLKGKIPRAVLLKGPPGTGKTFLVQAIAGETGFPVLAGSGSDFVEQYVGVGAARVRDAFAQARQLRADLDRASKLKGEENPCNWVIIFIDEFTSVGMNRAEGASNAEHKQTVDALLVELNGAGDLNDRILFIAATNQPEALDPAMVRPGRLGDLVIEISKPDKEGRIAILNIKLADMPTADDVDVERLAAEMTGMTGADIDTLVKKRATARARRRLLSTLPGAIMGRQGGFKVGDFFKKEDFKINMDDLWLSLMEMVLGNISETKGRRIDPQLKKMIAYHEAGHLTVSYRKWLQNTGDYDGQYGDDITDISILGPNGVGGFVRTNPRTDNPTARNLKSRLAIGLAGNVAERLFCGDTTGGCQSDLVQANRLIKIMLLQVHMSRYHNSCDQEGNTLTLPPVSIEQFGGSTYLGGQRTHVPQYGMSDYSAAQVDKLIGIFLAEAEAEAEAYLKEEQDWIEFFVPKLVEKERMRFVEIKALWDEFHNARGRNDLSRSFAFIYNWDENHKAAKAL